MKYIKPETKSLQVNAQTVICASPAPGPQRSGELKTMTVKNVENW